MDSGNSGSLQSSSGGDDDFDAACGGGADSSSPLSALLRQPGFGGGSSLIYGLQELGTPPLSHWCSTTAPLPPAGAGGSASLPSLPCHGGPAASGAAEQTAAATATQPAARPRGSRKRARASRRAPTTVLTTDTSNFRAMVQEFTGIPAPPFAGPSAVRSGRFDHIFPSRSSPSAAAALPQYLLRPFAHKLHAYPFTSPSTSSPANVAIAAPTASPAATTTVASGDSYQQLTTAAPSALLGMQDHSTNNYLSFQSTLGAQLDGGDAKYPLFDRGVFAPSSAPRQLHDPTDFLGLAHGIMSSEGTQANLHSRNGGDRSDELSGLVGGAGASSVTGPSGCKAIYSSAPPLLDRNERRSPPAGVSTATATTAPVAATAAMRMQGVDSWVCSTSE